MSPDPKTQIRQAGIADAPALGRIYTETWQTTYAGLLPDHVLLAMNKRDQSLRWQRQIERSGGPNILRVAEIEGPGGNADVVGFGTAGAARAKDRTMGEVYTLYVLPDWQGHGVGRGLLCALFAELRGQGFARAVIWVVADNPARFFYERTGGRRTVERAERLWGADVRQIGYVWDDLAAG
jgi:GNAT superfamily N-acetyltransferase